MRQYTFPSQDFFPLAFPLHKDLLHLLIFLHPDKERCDFSFFGSGELERTLCPGTVGRAGAEIRETWQFQAQLQLHFPQAQGNDCICLGVLSVWTAVTKYQHTGESNSRHVANTGLGSGCLRLGMRKVGFFGL